MENFATDSYDFNITVSCNILLSVIFQATVTGTAIIGIFTACVSIADQRARAVLPNPSAPLSLRFFPHRFFPLSIHS